MNVLESKAEQIDPRAGTIDARLSKTVDFDLNQIEFTNLELEECRNQIELDVINTSLQGYSYCVKKSDNFFIQGSTFTGSTYSVVFRI